MRQNLSRGKTGDELRNKVPEEMKENGIKIHVEKQALERSEVSFLSLLEFWERRKTKI